MSVFTRCTKIINEFLQRDPKERLAVTKRYLEPLSDVINGVPHKSVSFSVLDSVTRSLRLESFVSMATNVWKHVFVLRRRRRRFSRWSTRRFINSQRMCLRSSASPCRVWWKLIRLSRSDRRRVASFFDVNYWEHRIRLFPHFVCTSRRDIPNKLRRFSPWQRRCHLDWSSQRDIYSSNRSRRSFSLISCSCRLNIRSVISFIFG